MPAPRKIRPRGLADYLEVLTRAVFQAGLNWRVIDAKWDGFRQAFHGFDPARVAALTPGEIEELAADPRIVRNRRKIEATVDNAQAMLELDAEHGGFRRYLRSHGSFDEAVADLRRQFAFVGETGAYYFLHVVGEPVPPHEEWVARRGRAAG
ncbi:MAG TPA: DNA-3-methyladenine glycosylase I [Thermoleophilaceae bacterium]|nr:DNA-3-methyladenine glycosylase I [Thermoleophilaceae bacterium]